MQIDLIKKIVLKIFYAVNEKKYKFKGRTIRYLFKNCKATNLCVVFSAFPQQGQMPGYNYVKTLWNRGGYDLIFICDDMVNIPTGGSYYLGDSGNFWGEEAVESLLEYIMLQKKYKKIIGVGSSKGGTAALIFGLKMKFDAIIIGACQYKIGNYLNCPYYYKTLQALTGMESVSDKAIEKLNNVIKNILIQNRKTSTEIWFHYSIKEHTYSEQIKELLQDLRENEYVLHEDVSTYLEHNDVAKYFPGFLLKTLDSLRDKNC